VVPSWARSRAGAGRGVLAAIREHARRRRGWSAEVSCARPSGARPCPSRRGLHRLGQQDR
jgi:hypothetical protein